MKSSLYEYIKYEFLFKNEMVLKIFNNLKTYYPTYKFLSVYYLKNSDPFDENQILDLILIGSLENKLLFICQTPSLITFYSIDVKEFENKLLTDDNQDNFEFYKEECEYAAKEISDLAINIIKENYFDVFLQELEQLENK